MKNKGEYTPTYGEISEYLIDRIENLKHKDSEELSYEIQRRDAKVLFISEFGFIRAVLVYEKCKDKDGHHILWFASDNPEIRKRMMFKLLENNIWPVSAVRRGKTICYKYPEKILRKLLTYE